MKGANMKKGSKALRCYKCGQVVGWVIPTGRYHHGIPEMTQRLNKNGHEVFKGCAQYFFCDDCKPDTDRPTT